MKNSGFTAIEMLVTIAILAIVLSIGVPSFKEIIRSSDMVANSSDMLTALNYARMEAVKRGASVQLSQRDGSNWSGGLVVTVTDSGEELRLWEAFTTGATVTSKNSVKNFVFSAAGEVDNNDDLTFCDDRTGEEGRSISVLASGAVYAKKVTCS
jgi:type IV fimbrial biogenesis protein FimT